LTDEFRELNKETRHWSREREREKKEREEIREEEERQRARERENRRARFLAMAFWRRNDDGLYTAQGPSHPSQTYSDVRVLENYYLNKYIHGGKFETSFFKIFFPELKKKP